MANERIFNEGIISPRLMIGDQTSSGVISYDSSSGTININSNLNVIGNTTHIESVNTQIDDNLITLNSGQTGSGITAGSSGIEVFRGTGKKINFSLIEGGDTGSYWLATNEDGTGISIRSILAPSDANDLTNKAYVDARVSGSASSLTLGGLSDVQLSGLVTNQMIQWNGTRWVNVDRPPDGLTSVTLTATGGLISQRKTSPSTWAWDTTAADGSYTASTSTILKASAYQELRVNLVDQSVTPGTYNNSNITVNQKGIITGISSNNTFQTFRATSSAGGQTDGHLASPTSSSDQFSIVAGNGLASSVVSTSYGSGQGIQLALRNTGVSAGSYTVPSLTVDATGRITAITNGSINGWSSISPDTGGNLNAPGPGQQLRLEGGYGLSTYKTNDNWVGITLDRNIVGAGTYVTPTVTVDDAGRVTGISANSVQNGIWTNNGTAYVSGLSQIGVVGGSGGISTRVSGNVVYIDNSSGNFNQSLAQTGWVQLPNGLIMQWGTQAFGSDSTVNVSFPLAFPNAALFISPYQYQTTTNADQDNNAITSQTLTNTGWSGYCTGAGGGRAMRINWIVIGY